jgi:hypothetical protein
MDPQSIRAPTAHNESPLKSRVFFADRGLSFRK